MPCWACSQAAACPAVRQWPALSPARSSACTLVPATRLGLPGGGTRSKSCATPPAVKSSSHTWMVERARPANWARSASECWPRVAHCTTCRRSLSRGSVAARICSLSCAAYVALIASLVRFRPMPKRAKNPTPCPTIFTDYYKEVVLNRYSQYFDTTVYSKGCRDWKDMKFIFEH